jgi:hypothetical protein
MKEFGSGLMKTDAWKRPLPKVKIANPQITWGTQQELTFKPTEATPKEFEEWEEKELNWWADKQLLIVAIAVVIQFSMLGFMFLVMGMNQVLFK